jgi:polar amino acid transport system substrate-binding protein
MKRLWVFLVFSSLFSTSVSAEMKMLIAYENKLQFPYYMGNGTTVLASDPGVVVELIQRLERHIPEIDIQLVRYPWKRCLSELQAGHVDGIFNASFHPKRLVMGKYPWHNASMVSSCKR